MKILMVSIFAPHFFNWTEQLKDSGHEVYWLDVFDSNTKVEKIDFAHQIIGWRYKWDFPGRYFLKKKVPGLTKIINRFNERKLQEVLEEKILEIRPDVVHSFVMFIAGSPIVSVMKKYSAIRWTYSAWGSDMYFLLNSEGHLNQGQRTLPEIDYMFADCERDFHIARENGFKGKLLGVFPGGGGFDFKISDPLMQAYEKRKIILIKGYQGDLGRCIEVLKAIKTSGSFKNYQIIVFGAAPEVFEYAKSSGISNLKVYTTISHLEVLKLMGKASVYIGNSISDGMPNTLLEAIIMGAFPIQSNPGGATSEKIQDGFNGLLIDEPENINHIVSVLQKLKSKNIAIKKGINYNLEILKPALERNFVRQQVLECYDLVSREINTQTNG